ncbi:hypothetical protein [Nonomuraea turcica]|uniref:hypothetical protein n=1 Tax=Nonomuraea sp. G32 TaxID=3067274 RepID=UPI00273BD4E9|nr:hypothetical protein [Nonomuraea sp. G32]MDP4510322.1 hypothetical protein [Nonomuraea sp. G32]
MEVTLASPVPCSSCQKNRPNVSPAGAPATCPPCAGLRFGYQCSDCDRFARPLRGNRCRRCIASDVGPRRETSLNSYHERVELLLASVPPQAQLVVRRYIRWAVTHPLQRKVSDGAIVTPELASWPLRRVKMAARFATAVIAQGMTLAQVCQSQLDAWVMELPGRRAELRAFVRWAVDHGYMASGLDVPRANSRDLRASMDDVERLELVQRLLRVETKDPPARLAAVLVLLFGQRVSRLVRLDVNAVTLEDDGRVTLALSDTPVRLREPLAGLALQIVDAARRRGSRWLFPSSQGADHPLSSERLAQRIQQVGLSRVLEARNGALAALASQLPPALLAEQLGLSLSRASSWSKAVGADRSSYVGLRGR